MKCPNCKNTPLIKTEIEDVGIDSCPACQGVWLNHRQLSKLLTRSKVATKRVTIPSLTNQRQGHFTPQYDDSSVTAEAQSLTPVLEQAC